MNPLPQREMYNRRLLIPRVSADKFIDLCEITEILYELRWDSNRKCYIGTISVIGEKRFVEILNLISTFVTRGLVSAQEQQDVMSNG